MGPKKLNKPKELPKFLKEICRPKKLRKLQTDISKKLILKHLMMKLLKNKEKEEILRISWRETVGETIGIL